MTIDKAIAKYNKLANNDRTCYQEEAQQLAQWLEELKDYRDKNKMVVMIDAENMDSVKDKIDKLSKYAESQYNKAIDYFAKWLVEHKIVDEDSMPEIIIDFNEEQLKAGGRE